MKNELFLDFWADVLKFFSIFVSRENTINLTNKTIFL